VWLGGLGRGIGLRLSAELLGRLSRRDGLRSSVAAVAANAALEATNASAVDAAMRVRAIAISFS
jgi:hypothetical protein